MITQETTSILTFTSFPFVMVALWELPSLSEVDFAFEHLSGLQLVTQAHHTQDYADQELAFLVQSAYDQGKARGNLHHVATFTSPGSFTALRAAVALLDGLHVGGSFQAHYWNIFQVLFSKQYARSHVLWAVDNGRQAWCVGYMASRKMMKDLVLEVREDVSQASLEKFHLHCEEGVSSSESWETHVLWRHSSVEDVLEVLKKFALCVLYEDIMLKQKMQGTEERMLHLAQFVK
ncbi:hypothetical protein HCUR_00943 [Holospora curviuscula]|uniref:Uncharacterized protein n=2 Tax=Holospora curviuscula TaxID=1082868 RepID=A0A2S5R8I8_9PROT|nr:hypothetical protein HCUR_00943 [Holospora curviuscula]